LQSVKKQDDGPNDGDTNAEGLVFRDGRWHRDEDEQPAEESPSSPADPESQFSGSFDPETHGDYKSFLQLSRKIDSGELSFEEFQQAHKFYTENKEAFVGDLQKRYDAKTLRNIAGNLGDWQAIRGENKKNQNAESVYAAMMQRAFNVGEGISNIYSSDDIRSDGGMSGAAVRRLAGHVAKQTPESLAAHVEKEAKNIAEYAAANKANEEAAANPKTLKDFELAIKKVGSYEKLTTEQQETYDNLMSEKTRTGRDEVKKPTVVEAKVSGDHGGFELTKNFHSKRGQDIFTASPKNRVERDEYDKMNTAAKRLGGWYYKQFGGTPGGFHFPDEDKRNRFLQAMAGEKVDRSDILGEKQEEREKTIGEKLADHAERLEERASASYSAERKENTNRRAGMAASARASAEHDLNQAVRLRSISEAMAGGEVKHLRGMNALTQLESLQRVWRQAQRKHEEQKLQDKYGEEWRSKAKHDEREHTYQAGVNPDSIAHAKIPRQIIYPANVQRFLEQAANTPGLKQESAKWQKLFKRHTNDEKENLTLSKNSSKEWFDFANRAKSKGVKHDWGGFGEKDDFQRLYAMGIQEDHELRSALRELAPHQAKRHGSVQKDPVKELEKKIHREHKAEGFYPTPPRVIDRLMEHADIRDGQSVLEPSAGSGRIMDAVKAAHGDSVSLKGIEHHYALQDLLKMKGHEVEHDDFLQHKGEYDRIVMNPPFENDAAIDHVQHAFSLLKPGGKLVAVVPGGDRMYREAGRNKRKAFADFVDEHGEFEELPEASFAGSDAPRQTGVNTSLVILKKPEAPGAEKYSRLHIYEAMNGVIDRYVRPESEGVDSVQVDKYAHPLIHAAVGAGAMYLANKAFRGPMRSVAHMAIAAAMSAWMQSAMAAHGIPPAQGNQASSSSAVQPLTAGERAKSANNSFDSIVQNAIAKHEQRSKAAENAPPSAAQTAADAVVGDAVNGGSSAPQETAGKEGDRAVRPLKNRQDSNGASGGGSFNGDHPRHPAGSPQSKGGEFAPKGGEESGGQSGGSSALEASSPAESSSESPRNYPDNLNKPASEQTNYSPPERAIEPTDSAKPAEPEKSPEQLYQEHLAKIAASKVDTGDNRQRPDRRAAWEQTQQAMTQQILADKQSKKDEAKKVREIQKATSFNPSELEAESSQDQTERQARKNVIPDIANEHDLDHETLSNAVQDELKMVLPAHQRQEEARHYIAKLGWHAGRINRNEDSYKDHSTTNLDENASEWAGLFPEIAGTDESEWVAKMWDLSKKGKQDPPSASDEDFVRSVAKRLVIQGYASSFSAGEESSNGDDENDEDYQPVHGQIGDVDYTPFSRAAVVGLIVDKYMRLAGIC
jgi:protein-L-isoaspartate O-methyltransferase